MKTITLGTLMCLPIITGCAAVVVGPEALEYGFQQRDMWNVQDDINDGTAAEVAPSALPSTGTASFSGHFAVFDNDVNTTELLFGNANLTYDFAASTQQLGGSFSDIRLVDSEGSRVYGLPAPSVEENFSGSLAVLGTVDTDSVPFTADGKITDSTGNAFDLNITGDARFYAYGNGDRALSSAGATGVLTDAGGDDRVFSTGYMAVVE